MSPERAAQLRLARARIQGTFGLARLVWGIARGRVEEVWVGDSNAVLFATHRFPVPPLSPAEGRRFVWHIGPRLMYSIGTHDFPPLMRRVARLLSRMPSARRLTYVFSFGEIDVRCHLATRMQAADPAFIEAYVERVRDLGRTFGIRDAVIVTPTPPSPNGVQHESFPVVGTLAERLVAYRWMVDGLRAATERDRPGPPDVRLLDVSAALSDESGCYRADFTDDGTHPNDAGREVIRREFAAQCSSV